MHTCHLLIGLDPKVTFALTLLPAASWPREFRAFSTPPSLELFTRLVKVTVSLLFPHDQQSLLRPIEALRPGYAKLLKRQTINLLEHNSY